jgi:hypothetical protein
MVFGVSSTIKLNGRDPFTKVKMVVSSLKIARLVSPPMPGNRF